MQITLAIVRRCRFWEPVSGHRHLCSGATLLSGAFSRSVGPAQFRRGWRNPEMVRWLLGWLAECLIANYKQQLWRVEMVSFLEVMNVIWFLIILGPQVVMMDELSEFQLLTTSIAVDMPKALCALMIGGLSQESKARDNNKFWCPDYPRTHLLHIYFVGFTSETNFCFIGLPLGILWAVFNC